MPLTLLCAGVLRALLSRYDFWAIFACASALRFLKMRTGFDTGLQHVVEDVPQLAQLITFIIVFYNSVCYARFLEAYAVTNRCHSATLTLCAAAVGTMRTAGGSYNVARYALALFHLSVYEARGELSWETLRVRQLLSAAEEAALARAAGECPSDTVLAWLLEEVRLAWQDGATLPPPLGAQVSGLVCALAAQLHQLKGVVRMPVPFAYFSLLNLYVYVFCIAVAIANAHDESEDGSFVRFAVATVATELTFLGIRELSIMLADPFGEDHVDLKLDRYLWATTMRVARMLDGMDMPPLDGQSNASYAHAHSGGGGSGDADGGAASFGVHTRLAPRALNTPLDVRKGLRAPTAGAAPQAQAAPRAMTADGQGPGQGAPRPDLLLGAAIGSVAATVRLPQWARGAAERQGGAAVATTSLDDAPPASPTPLARAADELRRHA
jgi:predicted membrane chloride channel (bestrophin family)